LRELAYPTYSFDVSSANFFALDDFRTFVDSLRLGQKIYLSLSDDKTLRPILIGVELNFEDLSSLTLKFGDKYSAADSAFKLADLLEQSVSMGKNLDSNRLSYSAFIDSGASTSVKTFMESALDVAKNSIMSSTGMAITWDSNGMKFRKQAVGGGYDDEQIATINNNICFTDDGWQSAKMAIGKFTDAQLGVVWGVVAPALVGTLLAGSNLIIESVKQDGGVAAFKVDAEGASLHNAKFDIVSGNKHILLNPTLGIGIGKYPIAHAQGTAWDNNNVKFWVDADGNVHFKGTLEGASGRFSGELVAATGTFSGSLSAATGTFRGIVQASDFRDLNGNSMMSAGTYKFSPDYLTLKGLTIRNSSNQVTLNIDSNGNVSLSGSIIVF
jgi:hypothetical protein